MPRSELVRRPSVWRRSLPLRLALRLLPDNGERKREKTCREWLGARWGGIAIRSGREKRGEYGPEKERRGRGKKDKW